MKSRKTLLPLIIISILASVPLFINLGEQTIHMWDESRLAINALEMYESGDYLVTHFGGNPEMWNTKPPLMIWLQVLSMKVFGISEFSIRLPSAVSALLTCIFLFLFLIKYTGNRLLAFLAPLVMLTIEGYVAAHGTRTGDYDSLLVLITTSYSLLFLWYLRIRKNIFLYLVIILISLAVLTKSIAGLLMVPGIGIYLIWKKELLRLLKNPHLYIGFLVFILLVGTYYLGREYFNPGYLQAVYNNELGGRYLETIHVHQGPWWHYLEKFVTTRMSYWVYFLPPAIFVAFKLREERIREVAFYLLTLSPVYLLIISTSGTKLDWYDMQLYPFFGVIIAGFLTWLFQSVENLKFKGSEIFAPLVILIIMVFPYMKVLGKTIYPREITEGPKKAKLTYFLRESVKDGVELDNHLIVYHDYSPNIYFYIKKLQHLGKRIDYGTKERLKKGDKVIVSQEIIENYLENEYYLSLIDNFQPYKTKIFLINGKK